MHGGRRRCSRRMVDPQSGNRTKLELANKSDPTRPQVWAIPNSRLGIAATLMAS